MVFADIVALWHVLLREALLIVALLVACSGLDDLLVDLLWAFRARRPPRPVPRRTVRPMAIFIPAWDESAVLQPMLDSLTRRLDAANLRIFVGLYPNDPASMIAAAAVDDPRIRRIIGQAPGPTTKADCLNNLWQALLAEEARDGAPVFAVVLHDAEDVVHADELAVFDAGLDRHAMVQLPVRPLRDDASPWVSGHYLDEFAESHGKDLVVREWLGAAVPSAGVGCAIRRDMLGRIAAGGLPFDAGSLTEDYEIGHRIAMLGGTGTLARHADADSRLVATAEHFPATLDAALRQKARWLTGIALAGWDRLGWQGGIANRWMLLRDRKAPLSALLTLAAYALGLALALDVMVRAFDPGAARLPPVTGGWLAWLLWLNGVLLVWRLVVRAGFTTAAYGWQEGLMALPRAAVANLINAGAAVLAMRRYRAARRAGLAPAWEKTSHRFPDLPP